MDTLSGVKRSRGICSGFIALSLVFGAASTAHARQHVEPARVLVLGDSVFNAFAHVDEAAELMNERQSTIFATQGCQRLINEGCMDFAKLSALQQLRRHAGKFTDVVVVGTGYNDRLGPEFKQAVTAIMKEAESQGVEVLWVTYRVAGNVKGKSAPCRLGRAQQGHRRLVSRRWRSSHHARCHRLGAAVEFRIGATPRAT
jgi:hypothetical protein